MGSAQSARRIQPGGASVRAGGFPADLSRSPFLPAPPPARLFPSIPVVRGEGRAGGVGGGVGGGPPPGRRPAAAGRTSTVAVRRDRLRDGWEGPAGKVARGGRRHPWRRATPPRVLQPPGSSSSPNPGAEGDRYPSPRSPPPPPALRPPRGVGCVLRWGGPDRPSHGATALPPPVVSRSAGGPGGAGRTVLSAPRASSRRRARGVACHAVPSLSGVGAKPSARGRRRCRLPTRPVLKHGPRSLTRARVRGSHESRRGAMKVKGPVRGPEVGSRGLSSPPRAHHRPVSPAASGRWSTSACVRTRKMVNYAWAGRSQRKLWWRSVAVLTCKSVVRPGYRGERLIEPSSSWFPPKFPSG